MSFALPTFNPAAMLANAKSFVKKMVVKVAEIVNKADKAADVAKLVVQNKVIPAAQQAVAKAVATKQAIQTRTVEQVKKTIVAAKQIASATKKVIDEKIVCPLKALYKQGRENAKKYNKIPVKTELEPAEAGGGNKLSRETIVSFLHYGTEDNYVKFGAANKKLETGYHYDPVEESHNLSIISANAGVSAVSAHSEGTHVNGLLEHEVDFEYLSASAKADLSVVKDKEGVRLNAELGVDATVVSLSGKVQVNITPKSIYDNTVGSLVEFITPGSKFAKAPEWSDHGIVFGVRGEAGFGAAASVGGTIGQMDGAFGVSLSAKVGYGPMAGANTFFGFK